MAKPRSRSNLNLVQVLSTLVKCAIKEIFVQPLYIQTKFYVLDIPRPKGDQSEVIAVWHVLFDTFYSHKEWEENGTPLIDTVTLAVDSDEKAAV